MIRALSKVQSISVYSAVWICVVFFQVLEILPFSVQLNYIKSVTASGKSLAKSIPLLLTIQFFLKAYGFHIVSIFCFKVVQGSIFLSRSIRKISKFTQSSSNRRIGWFGFFLVVVPSVNKIGKIFTLIFNICYTTYIYIV